VQEEARCQRDEACDEPEEACDEPEETSDEPEEACDEPEEAHEDAPRHMLAVGPAGCKHYKRRAPCQAVMSLPPLMGAGTGLQNALVAAIVESIDATAVLALLAPAEQGGEQPCDKRRRLDDCTEVISVYVA
jgi:hypothetical protein